jgi:DNA-binding CsgD family transcriptional regulator
MCARDAYLWSGVATTLHLRAGQLHGGRVVESLTRRERECLLWASHGKSQEDVAVILGISARTVRFHQENAMCKLDAVNIAATVAAAVALGLI